MERIGIIGGSGLYDLAGITEKEEVSLSTPYGRPSDKYVIAELGGRQLVFLPRHGRGHSIGPSQINYRANIYGMKKLGAGWIISVSACGSLREEIKPMDFVVPRQFVDRTNQARKYTFFDEGIVAHISFAYPVCEKLANNIFTGAKNIGVDIHPAGTYLNMEGPQFSTLAESNLYRVWGMDIIGMTNLAEARLAREAEICYATLAAVTDYDCWRQEEVSIDIVIKNLQNNVANAKKILGAVIPLIGKQRECACSEALKNAIVTRPQMIPEETKQKLDIIINKYL